MRSISAQLIHQSRKVILIGLAGSVAATAAVLTGPAGTALAAPAGGSAMALAAGSAPMTMVHQAPVRGGDVATTWRQGPGGVEVRSAGPAGSRVGLVSANRDSAQAWTDPPASAAAMTPQQYAKSGRSVYWDALAAGMSKAQAVRTTLEMGDRVPAAAHVSATPKFITPDIFNSVCTTAYAGIYKEFYGTACLQQSYLESKPGAYYLNNQVTTSGGSEIQGFSMIKLSGNYCWCGNGYLYTRVGWSPSGTIYEGNPVTYTLTASGGGFSASIQESQYPQTLTPIFPSGVTQPAFGSQWSGSDTYPVIDSANSVAIVHEGPGSPGPARVVASVTGED